MPLIVNCSQDLAVRNRSPYQVIIGFGNFLSILSAYHHHHHHPIPYHDGLALLRSLLVLLLLLYSPLVFESFH
jgi:hypothetical protein